MCQTRVGSLKQLQVARLSESPERIAALQHLDFSPARPESDSPLRSCKIISECHFKPRTLQQRVTAATGP